MIPFLAWLTADAHAAQQCFYTDGTYGTLTVTSTGSGCDTSLTFGGITGIWIGSGSTGGECTYTFSQPVDPATLTVAMTAHSNDLAGTYAEEAAFFLDGVHYDITTADIDNSTPAGGTPLVPNASANVGGVADDGRGTISFLAATAPITSFTIQHNDLVGSPNGTIYLTCADDAPPVDSDGDGIPDDVEGGDDADGDSVPNLLDLDSDGDSIPDQTETAVDTDGDLVPDFLDLDSDDDSLFDEGEQAVDTDGDLVADFRDLDSDGEGLLDEDEGPAGADRIDPDTDDDGLSDLDEGLVGTGVVDADSDEDGLLDGDEVDVFLLDPLLFDSDSDGLGDGLERGVVDPVPGGYSDGIGLPYDGSAGFVGDGDPLSTTDPAALDTDGGGVADGLEDLDVDGALDAGECDPLDPTDDLGCVDTDADGLSDLDEGTYGTDLEAPDTDGDTLTDGEEVHDLGTDPTNADTDGGGVDDGTEVGRGSDPLDPSDDAAVETDTDADTDSDTDADTDADTDSDADADADTAVDTADSGADKDDGCGCATPGSSPGLGLAALGALAAARRRRRA